MVFNYIELKGKYEKAIDVFHEHFPHIQFYVRSRYD